MKARYIDQQKDLEFQRWIVRHKHNRGLKAWLRENPPPKEWTGSRLQWAYTEMPIMYLFED